MTALIDSPISVTEPDYPELGEVKALTDRMRDHQRAIEEISAIRKTVILSLRRKRITYREIAAAMGVTEQSVYKILRDTIPRKTTQPVP
jgi:DNA-directed RNA polymerase specialized sigma24 family protein